MKNKRNYKFKKFANDIKKLTGINVFENNKGARTDRNAFCRSILNQLFTKSVRAWTLYEIRDLYRDNGKKMDHTTVLHSLRSFESYLNLPMEKQLRELGRPIKEVYYRVLMNDFKEYKNEMRIGDKIVYLDPQQEREVTDLINTYAEENIKKYIDIIEKDV